MRLLLAMMMHETNTFSPVPTDLQRFALGLGQLPPQGAAAVQAYRHTGTATGAFIDLAEAAGAEFELAIAAHAAPSGLVDDDAFERMSRTIVDTVARGGWDGILLDLHGAMVTQSFEDGEGELLRRIRAVDADTPIGVAYDMHANVYEDMVDLAQVVAGYQTYPHVDMYETGMRAGQPLLQLIAGKVQPTTAWARLPMIPHIMRQSSLDEPNRSLQARARQMEQEGALAASVFTGFPHADIENAGLSVVVVTDGQPDLARVSEALGLERLRLGLAQGGQEHSGQDRDDRDHDEQLDQGEGTRPFGMWTFGNHGRNRARSPEERLGKDPAGTRNGRHRMGRRKDCRT
jgi:microcystin degradation protein MlrC